MCKVNPDWENIHSRGQPDYERSVCLSWIPHAAYDENTDGTREPPKTRYNLYMPKFICKKHEANNRCNMYMKTHT